MMQIDFVKYDKLFLSKSLEWLHDEEIQYFTQTSPFSKDDQLSWFRSLNKKENYKIWGILYENVPIGVCGLKNITLLSGEYWGYIGEKRYWGKGLGKNILEFVENEALKLNLNLLTLEVLADNYRARHLYEKQHFEVMCINAEKIFMEKKI